MENHIKSNSWFPWRHTAKHYGHGIQTLKLFIGLSIGLIVLMLGHKILGTAICAISTGLFVASMVSASAGKKIDGFFISFGHAVGRFMTYVLLGAFYILLFTILRCVNIIKRNDSLMLRSKRRTYWVESEKDSIKLKYFRSMFVPDSKKREGLSFSGLAVVLFVFLVLVEIGLRMYGFGSPVLYEVDRTVGYYPAPGQRVVRYGGLVELNNFSMRRPNIDPAKKEGDFRILMLGDSTLYGGSYIDQEDIYARRLERLLNAGFDSSKVEVLNVGVNAWGPFHEMGYIEKFGTFEADLAIIALPVRDIMRTKYDLFRLPFFSTSRPPRFAMEEVLFHLLWRYRARSLIGVSTPEENAIVRSKGIEACLKIGRKLRQEGIDVLFEVLPSRRTALGNTDEYEASLFKPFMESLSKEKFKVGFPVELFYGKGNADELYHDGTHLYIKGHEIYAEYLMNRILQNSVAYKHWVAERGEKG